MRLPFLRVRARHRHSAVFPRARFSQTLPFEYLPPSLPSLPFPTMPHPRPGKFDVCVALGRIFGLTFRIARPRPRAAPGPRPEGRGLGAARRRGRHEERRSRKAYLGQRKTSNFPGQGGEGGATRPCDAQDLGLPKPRFKMGNCAPFELSNA